LYSKDNRINAFCKEKSGHKDRFTHGPVLPFFETMKKGGGKNKPEITIPSIVNDTILFYPQHNN